jgi:hypothetical protein
MLIVEIAVLCKTCFKRTCSSLLDFKISRIQLLVDHFLMVEDVAKYYVAYLLL